MWVKTWIWGFQQHFSRRAGKSTLLTTESSDRNSFEVYDHSLVTTVLCTMDDLKIDFHLFFPLLYFLSTQQAFRLVSGFSFHGENMFRQRFTWVGFTVKVSKALIQKLDVPERDFFCLGQWVFDQVSIFQLSCINITLHIHTSCLCFLSFKSALFTFATAECLTKIPTVVGKAWLP